MSITNHINSFVLGDIFHEMSMSTDLDTIYVLSGLNKLFRQLAQRYYDRIHKREIKSTNEDERKLLYACQYGSRKLLRQIYPHKFLNYDVLLLALDYICHNDHIFMIDEIIKYTTQPHSPAYAGNITLNKIYQIGASYACLYGNKKQFEYFRNCVKPISINNEDKYSKLEELIPSYEFWECTTIGACGSKDSEMVKYLLSMFIGNIDCVFTAACLYGDKQIMKEFLSYDSIVCGKCGKSVEEHLC